MLNPRICSLLNVNVGDVYKRITGSNFLKDFFRNIFTKE